MGKRIDVIVIYADVDGSTRMSLHLSDRQFARIIQVFTREMSLVITSYEGYLFRHVGEGVVALFPVRDNVKKMCEDAINCSKNMIEVLEYVNPALKFHGLPPYYH